MWAVEMEQKARKSNRYDKKELRQALHRIAESKSKVLKEIEIKKAVSGTSKEVTGVAEVSLAEQGVHRAPKGEGGVTRAEIEESLHPTRHSPLSPGRVKEQRKIEKHMRRKGVIVWSKEGGGTMKHISGPLIKEFMGPAQKGKTTGPLPRALTAQAQRVPDLPTAKHKSGGKGVGLDLMKPAEDVEGIIARGERAQRKLIPSKRPKWWDDAEKVKRSSRLPNIGIAGRSSVSGTTSGQTKKGKKKK